MSTQPRADRRVAVSEELFASVGSGIEICYQTFGDPTDEPLLLVMGLGGPMTWWDPELCAMLAERGFFVIRYDNRDVGRSTRVRARVSRGALVRAFAGRRSAPPYTLVDMAEDGLGLLDHLGHEAAHVVGVSMGGMIAQTMAVEYPDRVRSLTSIMSTTGRRSVGWQHPRLLRMLIGDRGASREAYIAHSARLWTVIGSVAYPQPDDEIAKRAGETYDRGVSLAGVMRQMLAIIHQPNRGPGLRGLRIPALVIHGLNDLMVHVSGGRATAAAIPGAELVLVPGMGHDLPRELYADFADAITRTARRA